MRKNPKTGTIGQETGIAIPFFFAIPDFRQKNQKKIKKQGLQLKRDCNARFIARLCPFSIISSKMTEISDTVRIIQ